MNLEMNLETELPRRGPHSRLAFLLWCAEQTVLATEPWWEEFRSRAHDLLDAHADIDTFDAIAPEHQRLSLWYLPMVWPLYCSSNMRAALAWVASAARMEQP